MLNVPNITCLMFLLKLNSEQSHTAILTVNDALSYFDS